MRKIERCIICNSENFQQYKNGKYGKDIYICMNCKLVFTNPQPELEELKERYNSDYYSYMISPEKKYRRTKLWQKRLSLVKNLASSGKILDVGCGDGSFLYYAKKEGYEVYGIEISEFAAKYAKEKYGLTVLNCTLESTDFKNNYFDVITFWHTLEHLNQPDLAIKKAHDLLKPEGFLVVAVPNINDIIGQKFFWLLHRQYHKLYTPESIEPHLYHFSSTTLKLLLMKCGFKKINIKCDFAQVDPYWRMIEKLSFYFSKLSCKDYYLAILTISQK